MGRFVVLRTTQRGSVLYLCTKLEADRSFHSKVIRGPEISTLGHVTQATPILESFCFPYAIGVRRLSLYQIWSGLVNLFTSPEIMKFGLVTPATPT